MIAVGQDFGIWLAAAALLGLGTAMVYPTLLAAIGDVAHPEWRARSVGIYRLWRDGGFAVGALLSGIIADAYGIPAAVGVVAGLTASVRDSWWPSACAALTTTAGLTWRKTPRQRARPLQSSVARSNIKFSPPSP